MIKSASFMKSAAPSAVQQPPSDSDYGTREISLVSTNLHLLRRDRTKSGKSLNGGGFSLRTDTSPLAGSENPTAPVEEFHEILTTLTLTPKLLKLTFPHLLGGNSFTEQIFPLSAFSGNVLADADVFTDRQESFGFGFLLSGRQPAYKKRNSREFLTRPDLGPAVVESRFSTEEEDKFDKEEICIVLLKAPDQVTRRDLCRLFVAAAQFERLVNHLHESERLAAGGANKGSGMTASATTRNFLAVPGAPAPSRGGGRRSPSPSPLGGSPNNRPLTSQGNVGGDLLPPLGGGARPRSRSRSRRSSVDLGDFPSALADVSFDNSTLGSGNVGPLLTQKFQPHALAGTLKFGADEEPALKIAANSFPFIDPYTYEGQLLSLSDRLLRATERVPVPQSYFETRHDPRQTLVLRLCAAALSAYRNPYSSKPFKVFVAACNKLKDWLVQLVKDTKSAGDVDAFNLMRDAVPVFRSVLQEIDQLIRPDAQEDVQFATRGLIKAVKLLSANDKPDARKRLSTDMAMRNGELQKVLAQAELSIEDEEAKRTWRESRQGVLRASLMIAKDAEDPERPSAPDKEIEGELSGGLRDMLRLSKQFSAQSFWNNGKE